MERSRKKDLRSGLFNSPFHRYIDLYVREMKRDIVPESIHNLTVFVQMHFTVHNVAKYWDFIMGTDSYEICPGL